MEKVVKALFIFLLLIFPLGQIGRVELGGGVAILLNDIVAFLVVGSWLIDKIRKRALPKNELTIPITAFAGVALLSLILRIGDLSPQHLLISSLYLFRWITYAGLFFVLSDFNEAFRRKVRFGLLLSGAATTLLGFFQYFLYPNLRNLYYAGWDEHLYRLFSSFFDPNFAGGIFVLTFMLSLWLFLKKTSHERGPLLRLIYFFASVGSFIALLLTYSRGSFLSFLAGTLTMFLLTSRKKLLLVVLLVFVIGIFLLPKNLKSEGVELLRTASIFQRIESAEHALAIFQDNPLLGVGFNAYRYAQVRYGFLTTKQAELSHSAGGTDNSFIFVLATTGVIGLVAYLYLWGTIMKTYWYNPLLIASLIAIFVHAFFVNSLFYPWIMEWMWILVAASKAQRLP